jgi:hypothetical protein
VKRYSVLKTDAAHNPQPGLMDSTFSNSFTKAQQLHGVSLSSFVASVSISSMIFAVEVLIYLVIRARLPDI